MLVALRICKPVPVTCEEVCFLVRCHPQTAYKHLRSLAKSGYAVKNRMGWEITRAGIAMLLLGE